MLFAGSCLLFWDWIPDDAFISMRYAENLSTGNGLVFNPGERVEGYSNPLWTVALAAAARTGSDLPNFARWLSWLFGISIVALAMSLFERVAAALGIRPGIVVPAFGIFAAMSMPLVFYSTSGLETTAAAFFVLAGVYLHFRAYSGNTERLHIFSNGAFLLVALLRPEGIVFLVINIAALAIRYRTKLPKSAAWSLIAALAVFAAVVAWRTSYYGSPIPNTYFAKPGAAPGYAAPLLIGWHTLTHYFVVSGVAMLIPLCVLGLAHKSTRALTLYLGAMCGAQLAFIVFAGGDVLRFDRFTVVAQPLLLALALLGSARLLTGSTNRVRVITTAFIVLAAFTAVGLNSERVRRAKGKPCFHDFMHTSVHRAIGAALGEMLEPGSIIVANEVGAIPYLSGLPTIDMIGLTDASVARTIHESYQRFSTTDTTWCGDRIGEYAMSRDPVLVLLPARSPLSGDSLYASRDLHGIWEGILRQHTLRDEYRVAFIVGIGDEKYLHGFVRNDVTVDTAPIERLNGMKCVTITRF